jgi:hypothetical protein
MPEEAKDMEKDLGQKGGELFEGTSKDNPYEAYRQGVRDRLSSHSSRKPKQEAKRVPRTVNGGPGNPDSVVPMNDVMVRHLPGKPGVYREVDVATGKTKPR